MSDDRDLTRAIEHLIIGIDPSSTDATAVVGGVNRGAFSTARRPYPLVLDEAANREAFWRFRLEARFPSKIERPPAFYVFDLDRHHNRNLRDSLFETLSFFSMLRPIRKRNKKARKRRRVELIKARNARKRHLRARRRNSAP